MAVNQVHETSSIPGVDVASKGPNYNERYAGNESPEVYDLLGIGFGPANLAITVALLEHWDQHKASGTEPKIKNACFVERHPRFSWHPGMLLPGSRMQISFLKDLATLRNPSSKLTFLSYLHAHGRLPAFINRGADTPTRREYADYMAWAANRVRELGGDALNVRYGEDVVSVQSLDGGKTVTVISRIQETGELRTRNAKTLIVAPGGTARIPGILAQYATHPQVTHTSSYVQRAASLIKAAVASTGSSRSPSPSGSESSHLSGLTTARALRIAVLGSGQSSAEVLLDLRSRLANIPIEGEGIQEHQLDMIIRKGSLKPSDDSPFANEIFDPESTDKAFKLPSAARAWLRAEYAGTNYGVVNPRTIDALYEEVYAQRVDDAAESRPLGGATAPNGARVRINILPYQDMSHLSVADSEMSNGPTFSVRLRHLLTGDEQDGAYDAIVMGTGYERQSWMRFITWTGVRAATRRPPIERLELDGEQATIGLSKGKVKQPDFSQYIDLASLPKHKLRAGGGRIVFVGDIHGMYTSLEYVIHTLCYLINVNYGPHGYSIFRKLLKKLGFNANHDLLIHTGDVVLKGPQSREVIQELIRINALGVRGNQDQKVVEWRGWIDWVLSQDGGKQWLKKMEKEVDALKKPRKADYERFRKAASVKGWTIPDGWKFGDEIYHLARHLKSEEYQYLLSMPVALHIPSLHTIVVHAGILPMDPRRKVISPHQPLSHPPKSDNRTEEALRKLQELALLTDIPQNTDPWTRMNMRTILDDGTISRDKGGTLWSDLWHKVIKLCDGFDVQPTSNSTAAEFGAEDGWAEWVKNEFKGVKSLPCKDVTVIYGHSASRGLDIKKWSKGLDTGCTYNLRLTALVLGKPWKSGSSVANATVVDEDIYQVDEELDGEVISFGKKGRGKIVQVRCADGKDRLD
ncbi:unnamed protein product [Rhizoctonia solani]|uniref:L-ornithine N(5)-monooxygenase [NAD(P)H] n=1 Tax=Rhizoctonia solani TaxID=456999 RepID=A0A8H3HW84_9AGAM|nr:unnamed protein product [Rhizoctonia solani]